MKDQSYFKRVDDFISSPPMKELYRNNPVVYKLVNEYGLGLIVTKEECLYQIIIWLAKNWSELQEQHFNLLMNTAVPNIKP